MAVFYTRVLIFYNYQCLNTRVGYDKYVQVALLESVASIPILGD